MRAVPARVGAVVALALVSIATARVARAQAWVPDLGDGTIAMSTQYVRVMKHLFSVDVGGQVDSSTGYRLGPGNQAYLGDIVAMSTTISAEYIPIRRFAVSGEVVYTTSRYRGRSSESALDDGRFHGALQDMVLGARYMLPLRALALTPSVDVRFPLTDYNTYGHVGTGTGLVSVALGLNAGRSLSPPAPMAYVFTNYARVIVQDLDGFSLDRNQVTCGAGLFLSRDLSGQAHFQFTDTVDGVDWWWADASHLHHDNVTARALIRRAGLSVGYTLTRHLGLAMSWESTLSGANVRAAHTVTLGLSWSFWRKRRP